MTSLDMVWVGLGGALGSLLTGFPGGCRSFRSTRLDVATLPGGSGGRDATAGRARHDGTSPR